MSIKPYKSDISVHISNDSDIEIEWGISISPFGKVLIASSSKGIVHLSFLSEGLTGAPNQLIEEWPSAQLNRNDRLVKDLSHQIFQANRSSRLAVHLHGTDFQLVVWQALMAIPNCETLTYSELARHIGKPKSARAVGNAVGKNRIAYLIPCHRVIRGDGSLGGFRWGTSRKQKMLNWEKSHFTTA